jgi:N-acetylmuramoyl-L-alanine amidase
LNRKQSLGLLSLTVGLTLLVSLPRPFAQTTQQGVRLITREGSRTLPTISQSNQDFIAIDDLVPVFGLTTREDRLAGGLTIIAKGRSIIVTPDQPVVSVAGRLVSLAGAPRRQDNRWFVPLDFLSRALGPAIDTRIEVRRISRLIIVGDLNVPRVVGRVEAGSADASVTFEITPGVGAKVITDAGRILITFDADALELVLPAVPPQELLQALQPGDTPNTVRLATGPKYAIHRVSTSQPDASSSRLVVELLTAAAAALPIPVPSPPPTPTPTPPAPDAAPPANPTPATGVRTVVIDAGHGGDELGAQGKNGTLEKDVTLSVARRLRALIESRLGLRVFLTRDDDRTLALDDRSAYANSQKADVFVSFHANASVQRAAKGAEVYFLSLDRADTESRRMADTATGTALPVLGGGTRTIDLILWETAQARYLEQSSLLANLIEQSLRSRIEMSTRAVQQAPFRVLVGANMPAVLVEIGYLSNPDQEQQLASGAYQDQIALSVFDAIVKFREHLDRVP